MILGEHYPDDIRVSKEIKVLRKAGYDISLLCARRKNQISYEVIKDVKIFRVSGFQSHTQKGITDIITAFFFINPYFNRGLKKILSKQSYDFLHVHDLPLVRTVRRLAGKTPVIFDMHENYAEALKTWFTWKKSYFIRLKNRLFFDSERWSKYEHESMAKADHIVTVVDEMMEKALTETRTNPSKFTTVSNFEELDFINQEINPELFDKLKGKFIVSYTGNVGPHRGVDTLIESLAFLKHLPRLHVLIIGRCSKDAKSRLESIIDKHQLDNVELWGFRPFDKFYSYMKMSDVNVIPHNRNGHTDHTIPHKLFQSMMCGRPVLVSDCKPLKRIVQETNAGLIFEADNPKALAEKINELYRSSELCQQLATNGAEATLNGKYNWDTEGQKLVEMYDQLAKEL